MAPKKKSKPSNPAPATESLATAISIRTEPAAIAPTVDPSRLIAIIRAAELGNTRDMFALYRDVVASDSHLQAELFKRKLAVIGDQFRVLPYDKKSADDQAAAKDIETQIYSIPGWTDALSHCLDSTLHPVAVVEKTFEPSGSGYRLAALTPVPHYLIDYMTGRMQISDVHPDGQILSTAHDPDPARYIIHRGHILTSPDTWGGPMRSILFWWLLGNMTPNWWSRFLDRYGSPFPVGKYPAGDLESRNILAAAFKAAVKIGGLVVSDQTQIEIKDASAGNDGTAYEKFLAVCQREKSKLIVGQTLSTQADATGLGSGTANEHAHVRDDIRQFDAARLAETIRDQLLKQMHILAGHAGEGPYVTWGSKSPSEIKATADLLVALNSAGLEPDDSALEELSESSGISLRRKVAAAPGFPVRPFSADIKSDPPDPSADIVPLLRSFPAEVARIIRASKSSAECQARIEALYADHDRRRLSSVIADALAAHAAAGAAVPAR